MESRGDSVADLLEAPQVVDPLERDAAFDEVAHALFARAASARRIGRYELTEPLGRGGQGVVWAAYDPELMRRVAIKVLQVHGDVDGAVTRLRREAQALAQLSHPNVIAINDVGVCASGVFLVMQYVPGRTLSAWLRTRRSWREVVEVFAAAGRGLAAAHDRGVVHRDFKPSNVWIGDDGGVRLLDFGLAEVEERGSDGPMSTPSSSQTVEVLVGGTPPYMAPEQHDGEPASEASDQYAYCVTLFEALFGRRPFAGPSLEALGAEKRRAVMQSRPPDLSIPTDLWRLLTRGLRPAPSDRWPSMTALVDAMERSVRPRRSFVRVTVAIAVVAGTAAVTVWGARGLERDRLRAACIAEADRMDEVWNAERSAEISAALAGTGVAYAGDTWTRARDRVENFAIAWTDARRRACEAADVDGTVTEPLAAASRECFDERRETLDALLAEFADADADVVPRVATATASLPPLHECTEEASLRRRMARPSDPGTREQSRAMQARLTDAAAAITAGRDARGLEIANEVLTQARRDGRPLLVAEANIFVGIATAGLGRYEEGARAFEQSFFDAQTLGDDVLALRAASWLIGTVGNQSARHEEGLRWSREANGLIARLNLSHDLATAGVLADTAAVHFRRAEYEAARELAARSLAIKEELLGPEHPDIANGLNTLGSIRFRQGEHAEAVALHERALAIQEEALGPIHPDVGITLSNLATIHLARSEHREALAMFERTLAVWKAGLGERHPHVAVALNNAAVVHQLLDAPERAKDLVEEALAIQESTLPADHPDVGAASENLASAHIRLGEFDRARRLYERALAIREKALGPEHPDVAAALDNLGLACFLGGDPGRARELQQRALAIWEKAHGPDHPEAARALNNLGDAERVLGGLDRAEAMHRRALAIWQKAHGPDHPEVGRTFLALGDVQAARGAHSSALPDYERALAIFEKSEDAHQLACTRFAMARALWAERGDRARATRLATMARDTFRARGRRDARELAEVVAWLAAPGRPTRAR